VHTPNPSTAPQLSDWLKLPPTPDPFPAKPATGLGPIETPVTQQSAALKRDGLESMPGLVTGFRHSGWSRERVKRALAMREAFGTGRTLEAFITCGSKHWILRSTTDPEAFKPVADCCKSPWCKPCYRSRAHLIRQRVNQNLPKQPVRFLTLTVRGTPRPLTEHLKRLYTGFRRLRQTALWRERVTGGVAFLEVKVGRRTGCWHPHLHCLITGRYIPKEQLSAEWLRVTGDSWNTRIDLIRNRATALHYVTKYVTKVASLGSHSLDPGENGAPVTTHSLLVEAMRATKGRRRIITFGAFRNWKLLRAEPLGDWTVYAHENELWRMAADGDDLAEKVLAALEAPTDDPDSQFWIPPPENLD
jgi:hypothetical protein